MSYNSELAAGAMLGRYVMTFDCETVGDPDVVPMLKPPSAPANYKDQAKIDAYILEAKAEQVNKLALDPDGCKLVALAWTLKGGSVHSGMARDDADEYNMLSEFWLDWASADLRCGYNVCGFDLPVLVQRSRILGVACPSLDIRKYGCDGVADLMLLLHFGGLTTFKGQDFWLKRLGLTTSTSNPRKGSDIAALYAAGDWPTIIQHVTADVEGAVLLADRLGVR